MVIVCAILTKILFIIYILSILNGLRHLYILGTYVFSEGDEKYRLAPRDLLILGVSIAYVITGMITGIGLCV
jgi:hypothetical protein